MALVPDEDFSVARLVEEAAGRTGPWPSEVPFIDNLERLVRSCRDSGRMNGTGRKVLRKAGVRHLRNLLALKAYLDDHPDVAERPLASPVVVTGLPRTGTTLLHNLLAQDPAHRVLHFWEALQPIPPAARGPGADALVEQAERWLAAFYRMVPEFRAIHPATATGPEECDALLQNTFASQHFDDMFDAPEYSEWLTHASLRREYEHYALQLRILSASAPSGATWALKSPSHLGHLDALLASLPGCTVVVCHRHPHQAVASYASLMHALRRAYSQAVTAAVVGRQALDRAVTAMQRALQVRESVGGSAFVDVSYDELVRDPVGTMDAVYRRLGRPLDPAVKEAMGRWVVANPADKHGPHRYDLARFDLRTSEVDAAFAPYIERFGVLAGC